MNATLPTCNDCKIETSLSNLSTESTTLLGVVDALRPLISAKNFYHTAVSLSCILVIASSIGLVSNALVLATYWKVGFSESINISYFALGLSDIGVLGTALWGAVLNLFHFLEVDLPFHALELSSPTMYWPAEGFEKTTSCITAYIALERCFCVLFPLHVKRFMTRRKTKIVLALIFALVFGPSNLAYVFHSFDWKVDAATNKTMLRVGIASHLRFVRGAIAIYISSVVHFTALISTWTCTAFLTAALKRNLKERETNLGQVSTNASQTRNKRVIKTVLLIATTYVICSTPRVVVNIIEVATSSPLAAAAAKAPALS
ncbi:chemosensory receptor B [Elysia marginata]|uniref:Chemosensory receptor B n=1 Tax=Elysia marginata TaxID=1093978 RepID=A0AAV4F7A4_9GAST|nr:chemosensory receptor B [Elysia marginata]